MSSKTEEIRVEISEGTPNRIPVSFFLSLVVHALLIIIPGLFVNIISSIPPAGNSYIMVSATELSEQTTPEQEEPQDVNPDTKTPDETSPDPTEENTQTNNNTGTTPASTASAFASAFAGADTSSLQQVYSESTLNVRIRFPLGWSFQDNNVKDKLDAVTFIGNTNNAAYIPYVILEVKKKHLFYPSRFKYNMPVPSGNYTAYYSDPKELENLVTQVVYIRTETDEDYSITLRINGMQNYQEYRPVFMSMLKSFKFGRSIF